MAEIQLRKTQFTYNANANLVLQTNATVKRDLNAPTGEPDTLSQFGAAELRAGMGTRAHRTKPKKPSEKVLEKREQKHQEHLRIKALQKIRADDDVHNVEVYPYYTPKTQQTTQVFGLFLNKLEKKLGGQPRELIREIAHEVLCILKDEQMPNARKQLAKLNLLMPKENQFSEQEFGSVAKIARGITDFDPEFNANPDVVAADAPQVPILMENEGHDGPTDVLVEMEEEESDSGEETTFNVEAMPVDFQQRQIEREKMAMNKITGELDDELRLDAESSWEINPKDVDAYWLLRKMGEIVDDEQEKKEKADEVWKILEENSRQLDADLLECLGTTPEIFEFAKHLSRNRNIIVYCIRLKRAKDDNEKDSIEKEMNQSPKLARILFELGRFEGTKEQKQRQFTVNMYREKQNVMRRRADQKADANAPDLSEPAKWFSSKSTGGIDIDSLIFRQKGHFMSNKEWKLRQGSEYVNQNGYQEIYVPAIQAPKREKREIPIDKLPAWVHKAFNPPVRRGAEELEVAQDKVTALNEVQSTCFDAAFNHARNLLVCAPTGAGKTNVALLTMLREIGVHRNEAGKVNLAEFKIVYIAPMKSLVREMVQKFNRRLNPFGVKVAELSGDKQLNREQLDDTNVIIATPEKWDIVTRKGMDRSYNSLVKLIIIDEIHMLHDDRGPVIEAIVSRSIRHTEQTQDFIRLVGLSATLPNYADVAAFLRVDPEKGLFYFDGSYRPCPLVQRFAGITSKKPLKQFQLRNKLCYEYCKQQFVKNNQVLVFVHSRKETAATAKNIIEQCRDNEELEKLLPPSSASFDILKDEAEEVHDEFLKELLPCGVGIHHAGMSREDRSLVEDLFRDEHIKILVSTATLAYGVNLPAHAVIIKGTQIYSPEKGQWVEISMQDVLQMFGRAGRPGYDTSGEAYLITSHKDLYYYLPLLNELLPIESQLPQRLADCLNAEIVLGTVTNLYEATVWLAYTYFFVRMLNDPQTYKVNPEDLKTDPNLEQRRIDIAHSAASLLDKSNLIKYDKKSGSFEITELGRVCAHYYLTHTTIQTFNEHLKPTMSDIEIFRVFSLADEFKYMGVREEEQQELSVLKDKVPIPVKEPVTDASAKVNILLQAYIARLKLEGYALMADMVYVTQSAGRLMRALFEITLRRKWAPLGCRTLNLCKMIKHRMWSIESPLRQFKRRIPGVIIRKIEKSTFSWDKFFDLTADQIGELINFPRQGKNIHKFVHRVPRLELKGHVQTITRTVIKVELRIEADFKFDEAIHGNRQDFWILVEDVDGENILHADFFVLRKEFAKEENKLSFTIPIYSPRPPQYFVRVISDSWLGSETVMPISFRHLILPEKFPVATELLDLRPMAIESLQDNAPDAMEMYQAEDITELNSIQTQVFSTFFKTDDNIFLGSPSGSGKTLCAELAIIKMLEESPNGRCVYIAPTEAAAKVRYDDWLTRFGQTLKYSVRLLTGDHSTDKRYVANSKIIISNPVNWDKLSRRWRRIKPVQNVHLFVVDDMHLISAFDGQTLEMIVSRMRYMEDQTGNQMRFIGLATSVANYNDLADWIGASQRGRFNFPLANRPVPLDVKIVSKDINSYDDRQVAFLRPCYSNINRYAPNQPVIIFAPNRKYTRTIASDLVALASTEEDSYKFLNLDQQELEPYIQNISSESLKTCLRHGIGYIHEHTAPSDMETVKTIFEADATQIIVVERTLASGLNLKSNMVCIMGTSYYDGAEHTYQNYQIADIIKMMGFAQIPSQRDTCTSVIFTHTAKTDFYKKFLQDPFPVESHLDYVLADHLNAEIVAKTVENAADAVDLLTWTFYCTRLQQNPNYYSLKAVSSTHLSNHLSELVEQTLDELDQSGCITKDDDLEVTPQNAGMIASYYYIQTRTVDIFSQALRAKRKLKGLIDILCNAAEFEELAVRQGEHSILEQVARRLPLKISSPDFYSSPTKANVLLQTHFSRIPVRLEIASDRNKMVTQCIPLLWAMLDLLSTEQWLKPALICLELCQMITQGLWDTDSPVMQLPHITRETATTFKKAGVEGIFDLVELEDDERNALLKPFSQAQQADIAKVCNLYPNIDISFELPDETVHQGKDVTITVKIEREDITDDDELTEEEKAEKLIPTQYVNCPLFKAPKVETWFLVLGDSKKNKLHTVKRFTMTKLLMTLELTFTAPERPGKYTYSIYLMSDSYLGADQELPCTIEVTEGGSDSEEDSSG